MSKVHLLQRNVKEPIKISDESQRDPNGKWQQYISMAAHGMGSPWCVILPTINMTLADRIKEEKINTCHLAES